MADMTREDCMKVFEKYDPEAYDYYSRGAWYFGPGARRYAQYLWNKYEEKEAKE